MKHTDIEYQNYYPSFWFCRRRVKKVITKLLEIQTNCKQRSGKKDKYAKITKYLQSIIVVSNNYVDFS